MDDIEAENDFISRIDCNFPYHDRDACLVIIDEAASLSSNAMFFVIDEICNRQANYKGKVTTKFLLDLLEQAKNKFTHPLKEMILDTASRRVLGLWLTNEEIILRMNITRAYKDQLSALNILYFSFDYEDWIEPIYESIISEWALENGT